MPNTSITDALKEAYALAPNDRQTLDTIELSHPALVSSIYMVQDRVEHDFTLEDTVTVKTFKPVPFRFSQPKTGDNGVQAVSIAIDNVDREVTDFVETVIGSTVPVTLTYRPYLSDQPTIVQMDPPLVLFLTDIVLTALEATGRAVFNNIVNQPFLTEYYDRQRFPGLRQ